MKRNPASLTGAYLSGRREIEVPPRRRAADHGAITIHGATENNLKDVDVAFPLGRFVAVTGVSGAGKSTLVNDILRPALMRHLYGTREVPGKHERLEGAALVDKVIDIDQQPIGRTPRSNPATYTKVFDSIREVFAQTPEARAFGYQPGRFSFNVKGGRCEACEGDGMKLVEMHFLADVLVPCEVCGGKRFNEATLRVPFKGKNIAEVLDLSVAEALELFQHHREIARILRTLVDVGLGYIKLGQPSPTLSGGEAQRIKLSRELARVGTGKTLYILDEPTTGLHFEDVKRLLARARPAGRRGQHGGGHRAQPRRHQVRRLGDRPRPRGRRRGRARHRRGHAGGGGAHGRRATPASTSGGCSRRTRGAGRPPRGRRAAPRRCDGRLIPQR